MGLLLALEACLLVDVLGWGAGLGSERSLADPRLLEHPLYPPGGKSSFSSEGPHVITFGVDDQGAINKEKTHPTNSDRRKRVLFKERFALAFIREVRTGDRGLLSSADADRSRSLGPHALSPFLLSYKTAKYTGPGFLSRAIGLQSYAICPKIIRLAHQEAMQIGGTYKIVS